jgi:hypothetical protein
LCTQPETIKEKENKDTPSTNIQHLDGDATSSNATLSKRT